jgi:hypothetical protein
VSGVGIPSLLRSDMISIPKVDQGMVCGSSTHDLARTGGSGMMRIFLAEDPVRCNHQNRRVSVWLLCPLGGADERGPWRASTATRNGDFQIRKLAYHI